MYETKWSLTRSACSRRKEKDAKLWSLIDGAAVTAALQRTRAYYLHVDDLTQFDLHTSNSGASASGFVYTLIDQRTPCASLCVSCAHTEGQFGFCLLRCENCNFRVHLIETEWI